MAFNFTESNEFYSNLNNNYLGSDSEDPFTPRTVANIADYFYNDLQPEVQVSYNKLPESRVPLCFSSNLMEREQATRDEMEVESSDCQSSVFTYDNEDSSISTMNPNDMYASNSNVKFESRATDSCFAADSRKSSTRMRDHIDRILQGREISQYELFGLSQYEQDILYFINLKKSAAEVAKNPRRREEKQKLFFKSALKFIQNRFLANLCKANHGLKKKDLDSDLFYINYFQEAALKQGLDISAFYPPNQRSRSKCNKSSRKEPKSFNLKYIELLLSSKKFLDETMEFLDNNFMQNYSKARFKKIDKILQHAAVIYDQSSKMGGKGSNDGMNQVGLTETLRTRLQDLIVTNSKSKLPWSDAELSEAREFARQTIFKIYYKTSNGVY